MSDDTMLKSEKNDATPLLDLAVQYRNLRDELMLAVENVMHRGDFILGSEVELFERKFARFCGAEHGVGVANGTDAIHLALCALGIGPGDEVITAANTFAATACAICHAGATPVFVDVDPEDYNIDVNLLEAAISPRTKAIIPVHLYGQPAEMDERDGDRPQARLEGHRRRLPGPRGRVRRAGASVRSATRAASASIPARTSGPMATAARW